MAKINDLVNQILELEGISNYILVRDDGHTLSQNFKDLDALPSIITFSGLNCEALKPLMGLSHFKYLSYTWGNNDKLLIFPLGKYFLGISHPAETYTPDIVDSIEQIIESISRKKINR